jgi:hypothetical protein
MWLGKDSDLHCGRRGRLHMCILEASHCEAHSIFGSPERRKPGQKTTRPEGASPKLCEHASVTSERTLMGPLGIKIKIKIKIKILEIGVECVSVPSGTLQRMFRPDLGSNSWTRPRSDETMFRDQASPHCGWSAAVSPGDPARIRTRPAKRNWTRAFAQDNSGSESGHDTTRAGFTSGAGP